ncbi:MAG: hypothetical protein RID18_17170 [Cytophagales bacterium]
MKRKNAIISCFAILIFFGCSKEKESAPAIIYSADIKGQWVWVESWSPWGGSNTPKSCNCWHTLLFTSDSVFTDSDTLSQVDSASRKRSYRLIIEYDLISKDSVDAILFNNDPYSYTAYSIKQDTLALRGINMTEAGWSKYKRK